VPAAGRGAGRPGQSSPLDDEDHDESSLPSLLAMASERSALPAACLLADAIVPYAVLAASTWCPNA
jgi:hypothetical protein